MDESELRRIIQKSIKQKILEARGRLDMPPQSFEDFRKQFAAEMIKLEANDQLVNEAYDCDYEEGKIFDAMWSTWQDLLPEIRSLRQLSTNESKKEWKFLRETYVRDAVSNVLI